MGKKRNEEITQTLHRSAEQDRMAKHAIENLQLRYERIKLEADENAEALRRQQTNSAKADAELRQISAQNASLQQESALHQSAVQRATLERDAALHAQRD